MLIDGKMLIVDKYYTAKQKRERNRDHNMQDKTHSRTLQSDTERCGNMDDDNDIDDIINSLSGFYDDQIS